MNELRDPDEPSARPVPALDPSAARPAPAAAPVVDAAAFTAFYCAEAGPLIAFLLYLGAGLADAADLVQDTMTDAYRAWPSITHPRAWARRVASRKYGRRVASTETPVEDIDGSPLLPTHHDPTYCDEWEQRHEIVRLLAGLPWRQRQVMAWTFDGYTPSEIAAELSISPEAARASLRLARRALAIQLHQAGDDPR